MDGRRLAGCLTSKTCQFANAPSRALSRIRSLIELHALLFPSAYHAFAKEQTSRFGHDRALRPTAIVFVEIDDDPVPDLTKVMGASRVGMECRKMPFSTDRVEHGKPSL